jgi:hypothetical protein
MATWSEKKLRKKRERERDQGKRERERPGKERERDPGKMKVGEKEGELMGREIEINKER